MSGQSDSRNRVFIDSVSVSKYVFKISNPEGTDDDVIDLIKDTQRKAVTRCIIGNVLFVTIATMATLSAYFFLV